MYYITENPDGLTVMKLKVFCSKNKVMTDKNKPWNTAWIPVICDFFLSDEDR